MIAEMVNSIKIFSIFYQRPIQVEKIWGGHYLSEVLRKPFFDKFIGESIEFSPNLNGIQNLYVLTSSGFELTQTCFDLTSVLTFKLIDSREDLSIQVHPSDEVAKKIENKPCGKSEAWIILKAEKDSKVSIGLHEEISVNRLENYCRQGEICNFLNWIPVKEGDLLFVPSGTIHAIGSGIVLAEIQQSSDITYRIFDYNRTDGSGNYRELHLDKAMLSLNKYAMGKSFIRRIEGIRDLFNTSSHVTLDFCEIFRYTSFEGESNIVLNVVGLTIFFVEKGSVKITFSDAPTLLFTQGETFAVESNRLNEFSLSFRGSLLRFSRH